jgi:hypothetical protein
MAGLLVFQSLSAALRVGFHVPDRTGDGCLVPARTVTGWALALVDVRGQRSTIP